MAEGEEVAEAEEEEEEGEARTSLEGLTSASQLWTRVLLTTQTEEEEEEEEEEEGTALAVAGVEGEEGEEEAGGYILRENLHTSASPPQTLF